jgi:hypothetical protein
MDFLEWLSLVSDVYAHAIITGIVREVYFHFGPSFWSIILVHNGSGSSQTPSNSL